MTNVLGFIQYCNEGTLNNSEYNISRSIIENMHRIHELTLEEIAYEAHISTASVSRFIKKMGAQSFGEFKHDVEFFINRLYRIRMVSHVRRFNHEDIETMAEDLFEEVSHHLAMTKKHLDLKSLKQIANRIHEAANIIFLGDSHELSDFYTTQLDLLVSGQPCYQLNINNITPDHLNKYGPGDVVVFTALCKEWFTPAQEGLIQHVKKRGIELIVFAQEKGYLEPYADIIYYYGVEGSVNDGYYSLPYLNRVLGEMLYFQSL